MNYRLAWTRLSHHQRNALSHLSFAVPQHPTILRARHGVIHVSLQALEKLGFTRVTYYHEQYPDGVVASHGVPFWTLTQSGETLVRMGRR